MRTTKQTIAEANEDLYIRLYKREIWKAKWLCFALIYLSLLMLIFVFAKIIVKPEPFNQIRVTLANPTQTIKVVEAQDNRQIVVPSKWQLGNFSAYTASADECGNSKGITASGKKVEEGVTLACPPEYKFGTRIYIQGIGERVCWDRGGFIKGNKFDIYFTNKKDANSFGRRNLKFNVTK